MFFQVSTRKTEWNYQETEGQKKEISTFENTYA